MERFGERICVLVYTAPGADLRTRGTPLDAMGDPIAHSEPFGIDDGTWRSVGRGHVTGAFTIHEESRIILLVAFTYAG